MARAKPGWDPAMAYRYRNTWDEQEDSFSAGGGGSSASSGYATGTYEGAWEDGTQDPGPEEEAAGSEQGQPELNRRAACTCNFSVPCTVTNHHQVPPVPPRIRHPVVARGP